jgi:3-phenylpropionate/trans-cinnamate dioxygenase ferredoxin subunit
LFNYSRVESKALEFVPVADVNDLSEGERLFVQIDDLEIVLFNIAGTYYAIGDICSHDDGPLGEGDVEGHEVICPRHGARFDLVTGKANTLPAVVDIPAYPVQLIEGKIEIGIPIDD